MQCSDSSTGGEISRKVGFVTSDECMEDKLLSNYQRVRPTAVCLALRTVANAITAPQRHLPELSSLYAKHWTARRHRSKRSSLLRTHRYICPSWHGLQSSVAVQIELLYSQTLMNNHFHFLTTVQCARIGLMHQSDRVINVEK